MTSSKLDRLVASAYQTLAGGRADAALPLLDEALAALPAPDQRPALQARLHGWRCQALLDLRRPAEASTAALHAIRAARAAGDDDGVIALRQLQQQAAAQAAALRAAPAGDDDSPLALAVAALDAGALQKGELLALGAREHARRAADPRGEVFALLALARIPRRAASAIRQAAQVADTSGDKNLVTAVARAASAAGVPLTPRVF